MEDLAMLRAKAAVADQMAAELRLYRGFVSQFGDFGNARLFGPLATYDALFSGGRESVAEGGWRGAVAIARGRIANRAQAAWRRIQGAQ